jgi:cytochrome c peroxidase
MIITGIGSRETPKSVCKLFTEIGEEARERGWWVRSGHAEGADYAFEKGAQERCIVYLPWEGFNRQEQLLGISRTQPLRDEVLEIVYKHEAYAKNLKDAVKLIKSRNVYQVLGEDLSSPSDIVICWTEEGKVVGGTGLAKCGRPKRCITSR